MRRRSAAAALIAAMAVAGLLFAVQRAGAGVGAVIPRQQPSPELVAAGKELYLTGCVSCHGADGVGTQLAPQLRTAGAASADFNLSTGRMPAAQAEPNEAVRKEPVYTQDQIDALVAYIASLGQGPAIPDVNIDHASLSEGGQLYLANCASCHQSAGAGGALSYGHSAPRLNDATPTQVVEAMRIGPGEMPVFNESTLNNEAVTNIAAYVNYLRDPEDRGGFALGGNGPVPEGLVALLVGLGGLVAISVWIVGVRRGLRT
jgi:ubiquinol-cytochrome c reductase cytochrome c subunit